MTPCSTSLTNRTTEDYKKCVAKEVANEDPITSSFAAGGHNYIQGNQSCLVLKVNFCFGDVSKIIERKWPAYMAFNRGWS